MTTHSPARSSCSTVRHGRVATGLALTLALGLVYIASRALLVVTSGASLHVDEAQYWVWSRDLDWGYFSKPPVIAALIAGSTSVLGDGLAGVKAATVLCWAGAAFCLARLAVQAGLPQAAPWAAAVWLASPLVGILGLAATTDAPLVLAWAAALLLLWRALQFDRAVDWVALGAVLGIGLLSKYTMAALLPAVLWLGLWRAPAGRVGRMLLGAAVATAIVVPHLAWNLDHGMPTWSHTVHSTAPDTAADGSTALTRIAEILGAQVASFGPVGLVALGWIGMRRLTRDGIGREHPGPSVRMGTFLWICALPLVLAGIAQALRGRIEVNWLAPLHLSLALAAALALARRGAGLGWALALAVQAVLVAALVAAPAVASALRPGSWIAPPLDLWGRMRAWEAGFDHLRPHAEPLAGAILVSPTRQALSQALYHWRDLGLRPAAFNPDGRIRNHYEFRCPWSLAARERGPMLVLTEGPRPPSLEAAFERIEPLAVVRRPRSAGREIELQLAVGYGPRGAGPSENPTPPRGACR
jgi:4-amino-4-deoxy-L-arabinose transferase-like glycosyltransferase